MASSPRPLTCSYFNASRCRSCALLDGADRTPLPPLPQVLTEATQIVAPWVRCSSPFGSRAKAKMSVSGTVQQPIVGILDAELQGVELLRCPLHKMLINDALALLPRLISQYGLAPYSIAERTGELKGLILQTNDFQDQLRVRFVLRTEQELERVARIGEALEEFVTAELSISANIQPIPHQVLEGPSEFHIFGDPLLWEDYSGTAVAFPARAFMQVTPEIADKLYGTVAAAAAQHSSPTLIDLYCGAGGFALSAAPFCKKVLGIELSQSAVEAAREATKENELSNCEFVAADLGESLEVVRSVNADIVVCNPPRRGLSAEVITALRANPPQQILYSSCNAETLVKDFDRLSPSFHFTSCTPFEMFPLTKHFESLAVFERK